MKLRQRLLISIRGPIEALDAAKGGAHVADVEYPASALGTPYPLNIAGVRNQLNRMGYSRVQVSTNIGEVQAVRASACQAALGVAAAGADLIKFGLAEQSLEAAIYLAEKIVRTVRTLGPSGRKLYPAIFVDEDMTRFLKPLKEGPELARASKADGILIDTFNKLIGKGLLDYCSLEEIAEFADAMHKMKKEAWIAGSITRDELAELWATGVDLVCVRGAACSAAKAGGRFGRVKVDIVRELVATIPST
jgi:(5-formylfuran-3-yl)methyl phosphate synthase